MISAHYLASLAITLKEGELRALLALMAIAEKQGTITISCSNRDIMRASDLSLSATNAAVKALGHKGVITYAPDHATAASRITLSGVFVQNEHLIENKPGVFIQNEHRVFIQNEHRAENEPGVFIQNEHPVFVQNEHRYLQPIDSLTCSSKTNTDSSARAAIDSIDSSVLRDLSIDREKLSTQINQNFQAIQFFTGDRESPEFENLIEERERLRAQMPTDEELRQGGEKKKREAINAVLAAGDDPGRFAGGELAEAKAMMLRFAQQHASPGQECQEPDDQKAAEFLAGTSIQELRKFLVDLDRENHAGVNNYAAWLVTTKMQRLHQVAPKALAAARAEHHRRKPVGRERAIAGPVDERKVRGN